MDGQHTGLYAYSEWAWRQSDWGLIGHQQLRLGTSQMIRYQDAMSRTQTFQPVSPGFVSKPYHLLPSSVISSMFTLLSLSIPVCKVGILTVPAPNGCRWEHDGKCLPPTCYRPTEWRSPPCDDYHQTELKEEDSVLSLRKVAWDQRILKVASLTWRERGTCGEGQFILPQVLPFASHPDPSHCDYPAGELVHSLRELCLAWIISKQVVGLKL